MHGTVPLANMGIQGCRSRGGPAVSAAQVSQEVFHEKMALYVCVSVC